MLRNTLAIIIGYFTMAILMILSFAILEMVAPNLFPAPDSNPALGWILISFGMSVAYAVIGGYVTGAVSKTQRLGPMIGLAMIVIVFGTLSIILGQPEQPQWYEWLLVILGVVGVIVGGQLYLAKRRDLWRSDIV